MTNPSLTLPHEMFTNATWPQAEPVLSVLIPVFKDDPSFLISTLNTEAKQVNGQVEIIVLDDGSMDEALFHEITQSLGRGRLAGRCVRLLENAGRAKGRNILAQQARGQWLLFLDGDMLPDTGAFLQTYLGLITQNTAPVVFGGYSVLQVANTPDTALHIYLSQSSDCMAAAARNETPAKHLCTSNVLVKTDLFRQVPFDEGFTGWGWEDTEWALRVSGLGARILHVDNTATHLGLDTPEHLMRKYQQSAKNYGHMAKAHPQAMAMFTSFRIARLIKPLPAKGLIKAVCGWLARQRYGVPVRLRAMALKLYKSTLYSEQI
mgnify:CR=1 FL=1